MGTTKTPSATPLPEPSSARTGHDWVGITEAARQLGIGQSTLYRLTSERLVPFHRPLGTSRILFSPEDLAEIKSASAVRPIPARAS